MSLPGIEPGTSNTRGYLWPLDGFLTELYTVGGEQGWSDSGSTCIGGNSFSDICVDRNSISTMALASVLANSS